MKINQFSAAHTRSVAPPGQSRVSPGMVHTATAEKELFDTVVTSAAASRKSTPETECNRPLERCITPAQRSRDTNRSFEAFAMQTFIEAMLPDETVKMFGTGSAGKMWKSQLAEKLAEQVAASGRLRITSDPVSRPSTVRLPNEAPPAGLKMADPWHTKVVPEAPVDVPNYPPSMSLPWITEVK